MRKPRGFSTKMSKTEENAGNSLVIISQQRENNEKRSSKEAASCLNRKFIRMLSAARRG
jgi:hypothetical protein